MAIRDTTEMLALLKEAQQKTKEHIGDIIGTICGDLSSRFKLVKDIMESPFFWKEQWFWAKLETFLNGVYLSDEDRTKLAAKLTEEGSNRDNALRLAVIIDRAESIKKIQYQINATRCFLSDFIDRPTYFRICHAISNTLEEDLFFMQEQLQKEHLQKEELPYSHYVQGLLTSGLMYQSVFDGNAESGEQKYSFTPLAEWVDQFAVSYEMTDKYPNPVKGLDAPESLRQKFNNASDIEEISDEEIDRMLHDEPDPHD